jgi:S-DNA-T family DNA segregation ATPase FtsK/SpoIIIE
MIVFAIYLSRHPSTTRDNSRIGIGFFLLLMVSSGLFHLFSAQPQPTDGVVALSQAGGLLGWLIAIPFVSTITIWGAVPVLALFGFGSILIMTRTAPNKIGERLGELYEYLFGSALERNNQDENELEVHDAFDGTKAPWWRRSKKDDNAYDSALVEDSDLFQGMLEQPEPDSY